MDDVEVFSCIYIFTLCLLMALSFERLFCIYNFRILDQAVSGPASIQCYSPSGFDVLIWRCIFGFKDL